MFDWRSLCLEMYADPLGVKSMAFLLRLMEQGCRQPQRGSYHVKSHIPRYLSNNDLNNHIIVLTEEILHQLIDSLTNYLQGSIYARWCRVSSINSMSCHWFCFVNCRHVPFKSPRKMSQGRHTLWQHRPVASSTLLRALPTMFGCLNLLG